MKILCLFGAHQYGNPVRGESTEHFSFVPALRALGHEVTLFDSWNKKLYLDYAHLNLSLVEVCRELKPDVIFWVALTVEVWLDTLEYLRREFGIRVIHWAPDDSWKFNQHSQFVARHVDLCVTTYPKYLIRYRRLGATVINSGWGVPVSWQGYVLPAQSCDYDVTFVGTADRTRLAMVKSLRERGINIQCFGFGWPAGPIQQEMIPDIFRRSRISLNFANSSGAKQIKSRVFEVTGAGGFLLTEFAPGLDQVFDLSQEISVFTSVATCEYQIRRFLDDDSLRNSIALAGNQRSHAQYSYVERLRLVLDSLPSRSMATFPLETLDFSTFASRHTHSRKTVWIASFLTTIGCYLFGSERGPRFARRVCFEVCWRLTRSHTYRAPGLPGRMFYAQ